MGKLKFGHGNSKLPRYIKTFSLPAGHTCPGARDCLARVVLQNGNRVLLDGRHQEFRCFSASAESQYKNVYNARGHNYDLLRATAKGLRGDEAVRAMSGLLAASLPRIGRSNKRRGPKKVRIHVSGDYYSLAYLDAWLMTARLFPETRFYGYTKSIPFWLKRMDVIPPNFTLTASLGGKYDKLALDNNLRTAVVVYHPDQAERMGLEVDHDDHLAYRDSKESFALLLHGGQPAETESAKALKRMRDEGIKYGYSPDGAKA
jgi:hypothetical protein